jgi:hypothetical protein
VVVVVVVDVVVDYYYYYIVIQTACFCLVPFYRAKERCCNLRNAAFYVVAYCTLQGGVHTGPKIRSGSPSVTRTGRRKWT